jgi:hypothetical protein
MNSRLDLILEIARNNALVGVDQNQVDAYEDNMRDTIAEMFPDWTSAEAGAAEREFYRLTAARNCRNPGCFIYGCQRSFGCGASNAQ